MARDLMAAHDAGRVQVTVGRASDFFGPRAGERSLIGDWVNPPALADKPASVMGNPDVAHPYSFIPTSVRTASASANATTRSDASDTCRAPKRAPRATSSDSSTGRPAPCRG
jgi:hypothetical protein